MKYFGYSVPDTLTCVVGTKKSQIINTMSYYKNERGQGEIIIPSLDKIVTLSEIHINVGFPMMRPDESISAEVRKKVLFEVNANAFSHMKNIAQFYEKLKRGDLYKFQTLPVFGLWFLPEYIMEGIRKYDWSKHDAQVNSWMEKLEKDLSNIGKEGHIIHVKKVPAIGMN